MTKAGPAPLDDKQRVDTKRPTQRRSGGRTAKVSQALLAAAARILLEQGYEALGHRQVAIAAGIADSTVYRRWPSKHLLVLATVEHLASQAIQIPDLGSAQADLDALAGQLIGYLSTPGVGRMIAALITAIAQTDEASSLKQLFWSGRFAGAAVLVERAKVRGEMRADADATEVIETMAGPIYMRLLVTGAALDEALRVRVVKQTLRIYGV